MMRVFEVIVSIGIAMLIVPSSLFGSCSPFSHQLTEPKMECSGSDFSLRYGSGSDFSL